MAKDLLKEQVREVDWHPRCQDKFLCLMRMLKDALRTFNFCIFPKHNNTSIKSHSGKSIGKFLSNLERFSNLKGVALKKNKAEHDIFHP